MVGDLYAARYLSQEGADLLDTGKMMEWTPGAALGNAMERRSYVTPSQYAVYEAQLGREGAAKLYSKTFKVSIWIAVIYTVVLNHTLPL